MSLMIFSQLKYRKKIFLYQFISKRATLREFSLKHVRLRQIRATCR